MKYIQIVDAEQYLGDSIKGVKYVPNIKYKMPYVTTIQGRDVLISIGDWIIDEGDGEHFYPITDYIFKKKYKLKK